MNLFYIHNLNQLWKSFLNQEEQHYYFNRWDLFFFNVFEMAASNGWLDLLIWFGSKRIVDHNHLVMTSAIRYGHIEIVKWCIDEFGLHVDTFWASFYGQLKILKLLYSKKIPLNQHTLNHAIQQNHLNIVKWIKRQKNKY